MQQDKVYKWLLDIKASIDEIETFMASENQDFERFQKTLCLNGHWSAA
jgi:hypothetical protein